MGDSLCAQLDVPLSPESDDTLPVFLRKFPARQTPAGEIWLLAGGPGESGAGFYARIDALRARFPMFDLFVPDHRGTGLSGRLCAEELPGSENGTALAGAEFGACFGGLWADAERTAAFSMSNAARDLDRLIGQFGGAGPRYVYGVSYGTGYALRYAQLRTTRVDGLILDSLVPSLRDGEHDLSHRSQTTDQVGRVVLADCAANPVCNDRFEDGVERAYTALLGDLAAGQREGLVAAIPGGNFKHLLGALLDVPAARTMIPDFIHAAINDPASLPELIAAAQAEMEAALGAVMAYPNSDFSIPLAAVIGMSETNLRPDITSDAVTAEEADLWFTTPLAMIQTYSSTPTYAHDAYFAGQQPDLPRVLVVQGDRDPKTPLAGALTHIAELAAQGGDVSLVTVTGAPHALWYFAPDCLDDAIAAFIAGETIGETCALPGHG